MKTPIDDKSRMDWIEKQSNLTDWVARQSNKGRGFRLHNVSQHEHNVNWPFGSVQRTAREAIDAAMDRDP